MISKKKLSNKYSSRQSNKKYIVNVNLNEYQVELILLYNTIINHILLMIINKVPKIQIKNKIIKLFKQIRNHNKFISKDISDTDLEKFFNIQYNQTKKINQNIISYLKCIYDLKNNKNNISKKKCIINTSRHTSRHSGGFYFKNLEEKGDQPLTGNDLAKLLDEMQQFFYNAQYTEEGKFLQDTNTVISMMRGDLGQFKGILQYRIFPKYYSIFPPFLNFANIKKDLIDERKWEDLPDYLLAYQSYLRSRDEYLVEKGLKSPDVLNKDLYTGFFNKVANSLDQNIQKFQQYRNKSQGKLFPISLPA